jgi:ferredoxin, 2Fe-2S
MRAGHTLVFRFMIWTMPEITILPDNLTVTVDVDTSLRDAVHAAGLHVQDRCGGMGACCSCSVFIVTGHENLTPKTLAEDATFYLTEQERLSCQCRVVAGDVTIRLA